MDCVAHAPTDTKPVPIDYDVAIDRTDTSVATGQRCVVTQPELATLEGNSCLITGATSGIGLVTAETLAARGARVLVVGRDEARVSGLVSRLNSGNEGARHTGFVADLTSQADLHRLAKEVGQSTDRLDVLVNNAGVMTFERQLTVDGWEYTFALNHLAYFTLTQLLLPLLRVPECARVVSVASDAHRSVAGLRFDDLHGAKRYGGWRAYCQSKLANILFTRELARRLKGTRVTANSLHPGFVQTRFFRKPGFRWWLMGLGANLIAISPEKGAATSIYLASSAEVAGAHGRYFTKCRAVEPSRAARDDEAAARLWDVSQSLTGVG